MQAYEYKVIPAPVRGEKERGLKTGAERFAHALGLALNALAAEGWEYWRAETLPAEERTGLTSKTTVFHNLLVFRRPVGAAVAEGAEGAAEMVAPQTAPPAASAFARSGVFAALSRAEAEGAGAERRGALSAQAPEGRAPRLGPAEEEKL